MADPFLATATLTIRSEAHPLAPAAIAVSRTAALRLASERTWSFTTEAHANHEFTSDVPNVDPERLAHLDDRGVALIGTEVVPGTILVGRSRAPRHPIEQSPEEREIERAFGVKSGLADASLRCPPGVSGRVVSVEQQEKQKKQPASFTVTIVGARPLAIGDVLELDDGTRGIVAAVVDDLGGAGLAWPGIDGQRAVHKVSSAADRVHARSIGPYSLVTQQPLKGTANFGGQRVGPAEIDALLLRGASWIVHELMTVKSDDVSGRVKLYESIVRGAPECVPSMPRATRVLERELIGLGFDVDFERGRVSIRLHDDASLRQLAPHEVKKPETLNYRTLKPERGGLFCEEVFGELTDPSRAERLGRIELASPVLHPWAVGAAALLLDLPEDRIEAVIACELTLAGGEPQVTAETGPGAVKRALEAVEFDTIGSEGERGRLANAMRTSHTRPAALCFQVWPVLPPDLRPLVPLEGGRFATSDLNDLYRRVINRNNRLRRLLELNAPDIIIRNETRQLQEAMEHLVENGLGHKQVTGPNRRPLVSLADMLQGEGGRFHANLLGKRVDYSAVGAAVTRGDVGDGEVRIPRAVAAELFRPWAYERLERDGHVTTLKSAKKLLEAANPHALLAIESAATGSPAILFPGPPFSPGLPFSPTGVGGGPKMAAPASCPVASLDISLWDEAAIGLSPADYQALALSPGDAVVLHLPVDPRAIAEARTALRRPPPDAPVPSPSRGWLLRTVTAERVGPVLFEAALAGETDPVSDDRTQLMLGRRVER